MPQRRLFVVFCMAVSFYGALSTRAASASQLLAYPQPSSDVPLRFSILHTNDLHSHFEGNGPDHYALSETPQGLHVKGHYARLVTLIKQQRSVKEKLGPVMLLDAGDFYSGSLFHLLGAERSVAVAPELDFFRYLHYDAITLGNHEFDPSEKGLARMLGKGEAHGFRVPVLASNIEVDAASPLFDWVPKPAEADGHGHSRFQTHLLKDFPLQGGGRFRVGLLGLMGPDAAYGSQKNRSSAHFVGYDDHRDELQWSKFSAHVQKAVTDLRQHKQADVVVVLLHGGYPEDAKLAQSVTGIDVIIAGHTHAVYDKPLLVNQTVINQAGSYGQHLGTLDFAWDGTRLTLLRPLDKAVLAVDHDIPAAPAYLKRLDRYKKSLDELLAENSDYAYRSEVFTAVKSLHRKPELFNEWGQLVTEGLAVRLNHLITAGNVDTLDGACTYPPAPDTPVSLYFTALSLIRADLEGQEATVYQFSDIFRILSIGFDRAQKAGYPVVTYFLTPRELYQMVSMFEYASRSLPDALPAFPKAVSFRKGWGLPMINRVKELRIGGVDYQRCQPLIRVASNRFMIENVVSKSRTKSLGLINIVPKDWQGHPVVFDDQNYPREFVLLADYFKFHYRGEAAL